MDVMLIAGRLVHVMAGIFWVGAMMFVAFYLVPALRDVGPDAGKMMVALRQRGFMRVIPVMAVLTLLSGFWLFWRVSAGAPSHYLFTGPGHVYAVGGLVAVIAFAIGISVTRPAMLRATALAEAMATASPAEREGMMSEAQAARERGARWGRVVAWMLVFSALAMAVGRYI